MKSCALVLLFVAACQGQALVQYTPDKADWSTFNEKAVLNHPTNTDHSPDGIFWIDRNDWQEWDGTIYNPEEHTKKDFAALICQGSTIRGLHTLFYDNNPFADIVNPTKAEVDNWHAMAVNHVRAMVNYTGPEYTIKPDICLHIRALWSDERKSTRMWDTDEYPGTCQGSSNPHCGAGFIPNVADQQDYLPDGINSCGKRAGSEGLFSAAKSNIPWSIKWTRPFCATLGGEGFWGGHTGPWFHRTQFGWSWSDFDPLDFNSNAGLRTKWSGSSGPSKYENPDITSGKFTVNVEGEDPNPRFPGFECEEIVWSGAADSATACYERMIGDPSCGKKFMTFNTGNFGCACYPPSVNICKVNGQPFRQTWDFDAVVSSFDGFLVDTSKKLTQNALPYNGRECPNIIWKTESKAGDPSDCLQKIIEGNFADCGRKFITWNSANGGCACYPPSQETCTRGETIGRSGRQTYELEVDPSYNPPTTPSPTPLPPPSAAPIVTPADCIDDLPAKFLLKVKKNKNTGEFEAKSRSCGWLKSRTAVKRDNFCKKRVKCTIALGSAQDICPEQCEFCGKCEENGRALFFLKLNDDGMPVTKRCSWLAKPKRENRATLCKRTVLDGCYGRASEVCPVTCFEQSGC